MLDLYEKNNEHVDANKYFSGNIVNTIETSLLLVSLPVYIGKQGAVSIRKTVLPGMAIPLIKIRRPNGRLIFNMGIPIPGKDGLYIEAGRRIFFITISADVLAHNGARPTAVVVLTVKLYIFHFVFPWLLKFPLNVCAITYQQ